MQVNYPEIRAERKKGGEKFRFGNTDSKYDVLDLWRWSFSDLIENVVRGSVAEYIVGRALGTDLDTKLRESWAPYDLETPNQIKIEVKSAAYIQSWGQKNRSAIRFRINQKTKAWSNEKGKYIGVPKRHADVYVLAVHKHDCQETIDPLDFSQWEFYTVRTKTLDKKRTLSLKQVRDLVNEQRASGPIHFNSSKDFKKLKDAVQRPGRRV